MATLNFKPKAEIWQFRECTMKIVQYNQSINQSINQTSLLIDEWPKFSHPLHSY